MCGWVAISLAEVRGHPPKAVVFPKGIAGVWWSALARMARAAGHHGVLQYMRVAGRGLPFWFAGPAGSECGLVIPLTLSCNCKCAVQAMAAFRQMGSRAVPIPPMDPKKCKGFSWCLDPICMHM